MDKELMSVTKDGAIYFTEPPHFISKEMWQEFISKLNMDDEKIRILVEELEYLYEQAGKYYEYYIEATL